MSIALDPSKKGSVGEYLKENIKNKAAINISSPIFTIYAFDELKKSLESISNMKFLFNEPTFIRKIESNQREVKEFQLQIKNREKNKRYP